MEQIIRCSDKTCPRMHGGYCYAKYIVMRGDSRFVVCETRERLEHKVKNLTIYLLDEDGNVKGDAHDILKTK